MCECVYAFYESISRISIYRESMNVNQVICILLIENVKPMFYINFTLIMFNDRIPKLDI